jgi:hypothetical protein
VHRRHRLFGGYGRLLVEMINDQAGTRLRGAVASRADRCGTTGLACRGIAVGAECDRRLDVVVFAEGTAPAVTGELSWSSRWRPVQAEERRAEVVLARLPAGPPRRTDLDGRGRPVALSLFVGALVVGLGRRPAARRAAAWWPRLGAPARPGPAPDTSGHLLASRQPLARDWPPGACGGCWPM